MEHIRTAHANTVNPSTCSQQRLCQYSMYSCRLTPVHGSFRCLADFNRKSRMSYETPQAPREPPTPTANLTRHSFQALEERTTNSHPSPKATLSNSNQAHPARRIPRRGSQTPQHQHQQQHSPTAKMSLNTYINSPSPPKPFPPSPILPLTSISFHRESPHHHSRRPHPNRHARLLRPSNQPRPIRHDRAHHPRARRRRTLDRTTARLVSGEGG